MSNKNTIKSTWIPRWLETELHDWLKNSTKGLILFGARQTGKSSLLKKMLSNIEDLVYYSYANPTRLSTHRISLEDLRGEIISKLSKTSSVITVFIDEAPRNLEAFVRD